MRESLFRGKRLESERSVFDDTDWVVGSLIDSGNHSQVAIFPWVRGASTFGLRQLVPLRMVGVDAESVGRYTEMTDENGKAIFEGDIVDFFGSRGVVTFECGAFGVVFKTEIDYDTMQQRIYDHTRTRNPLNCCFNDNFISLWEISWNFDCEENCCHVLEVMGNIHDNPELLKGGTTDGD